MADPYVTIDIARIEHNARSITALCRQHGMTVTGVTKGTCGHPAVARAMLRGGVVSIGESRLHNIQRLKAHGVPTPYMLLRVPSLSDVDEVVTTVDISLNSEVAVIAALSEAAQRHGVVHKIIVMLDLGDLREGVWPDDLLPFAREIIHLPGIRLVGLGTNLSCYGGVMPSEDNMRQLVEHACQLERTFQCRLPYISGGNSSALPLLAAGKMPRRINHLRIGEGMLLGRETVHRTPWPDTFQDAFCLYAEVIESKVKPSVPLGLIGEDAFGTIPTFVDHGERQRALVNIGREDVDMHGLTPLDQQITILGASSDYLLVDVTDAGGRIRLGDWLAFALNYCALLAVMTSEYVVKREWPQATT